MASKSLKIATLSDTHGLLRKEVLDAIQGVDYILHAGDICSMDILRKLEAIAPTYIVAGNCDYGKEFSKLPRREVFTIEEINFYMLHDLTQLDIDLQAANIDVVIHGHTHLPSNEKLGECIIFNPGSAGPRRYDYPISMGFIEIENGELKFSHYELV